MRASSTSKVWQMGTRHVKATCLWTWAKAFRQRWSRQRSQVVLQGNWSTGGGPEYRVSAEAYSTVQRWQSNGHWDRYNTEVPDRWIARTFWTGGALLGAAVGAAGGALGGMFWRPRIKDIWWRHGCRQDLPDR